MIRDNLGQVDGLAVDWINDNIYWTDYIFERLEMAKMDGTSRRTVVYMNVANPSLIAVDPILR